LRGCNPAILERALLRREPAWSMGCHLRCRRRENRRPILAVRREMMLDEGQQ
jgi:hypothetical protein